MSFKTGNTITRVYAESWMKALACRRHGNDHSFVDSRIKPGVHTRGTLVAQTGKKHFSCSLIFERWTIQELWGPRMELLLSQSLNNSLEKWIHVLFRIQHSIFSKCMNVLNSVEDNQTPGHDWNYNPSCFKKETFHFYKAAQTNKHNFFTLNFHGFPICLPCFQIYGLIMRLSCKGRYHGVETGTAVWTDGPRGGTTASVGPLLQRQTPQNNYLLPERKNWLHQRISFHR